MGAPAPRGRGAAARRRAACAIAALALAAAPLACAGGFGTSKERADVLFRDGKRLAEGGDCAGAIAKLRTSFELDPAPGALFNLAECEERLGKHASAWRHFRAGGAMLPRGDDRAPSLSARLADVATRLSWLRVELAPRGSDETAISLDDVDLVARELAIELAVDPGPHEIVVRAPGRVERHYPVDVKPGARVSLAVTVGDAVPPPPPSPASR